MLRTEQVFSIRTTLSWPLSVAHGLEKAHSWLAQQILIICRPFHGLYAPKLSRPRAQTFITVDYKAEIRCSLFYRSLASGFLTVQADGRPRIRSETTTKVCRCSRQRPRLHAFCVMASCIAGKANLRWIYTLDDLKLDDKSFSSSRFSLIEAVKWCVFVNCT